MNLDIIAQIAVDCQNLTSMDKMPIPVIEAPLEAMADKATFKIAGTEEMISALKNTAIKNCSVHGLWKDSREIEIIPATEKLGKKCKRGMDL
ncbi:MAG: hypothetical protein JW705_04955 [Methanosarcinaceae archaeon]|nr:hypothetical protein [Methanosarcinaceae archaeon]